MTDAQDRIAHFQHLIEKNGDPRGSYAAAIAYIQTREERWATTS